MIYSLFLRIWGTKHDAKKCFKLGITYSTYFHKIL